ncbi:hypothetical protein CRE_01277 [Caenorhabditis remanei]|uniref:Uncharacterized protein n=1 Tax=Caenorhabditis remanei TaxID=31234 RepID=E3N9Q7_CAERE|nr:hypothetical protein CRE_01277 [Caenorhabditis remanei]
MDNHESTKQLVYTLLERLANTLALVNDVAWNRGEAVQEPLSNTLQIWGVPEKLKEIRDAPPTKQTELVEAFLVEEHKDVEQEVEWMSEEIAGQKDLIKSSDCAVEAMEEKLDIEAEEIRRLRALLKKANDSIIDKDYVIGLLREDIKDLKSTPEAQIQKKMSSTVPRNQESEN